MGICRDFNCHNLKENKSEKDIKAGNFCLECQGSDGHYTWYTPLFANDSQEIWQTCANQMVIHDPNPDPDNGGQPLCVGYKRYNPE